MSGANGNGAGAHDESHEDSADLPTVSDPTDGGKYCGAHTRQDGSHEFCRQGAGARTDHKGRGRCWLHGGRKPITHGRRSSVHLESPRLRELVEHFEDDPDPLNIFGELATCRALYVDFLNRYEENRDALLAWHESYEVSKGRPLPEEKIMAFEAVVDEWENAIAEMGDKATERQQNDIKVARTFIDLLRGRNQTGPTPRPRVVLDIADAYRIVGECTKIVERIEKIRAANAISRADFRRLTEAMAAEVMKHVEDPETLRKIRNGWLSIVLG